MRRALKRIVVPLTVALAFGPLACGRSSVPPLPVEHQRPVPGAVDRPSGSIRCLDPELAKNGTAPTPARHELACSFYETDDLGPVAQGTRTFDGSGRVTSERLVRLDDPPRTTSHDYVYGSAPRDSVRTVAYDSSGRVTRQTDDEGSDGDVEVDRLWTFDLRGNETSSEVRSASWRSKNAKTWDETGFLTRDEWFTDEVSTWSTQWTRRPDGAPLTAVQLNASGVLGSMTKWSYDSRGVIHEMEVTAADGKRISKSRYDAAGQLVEVLSGWNHVDDAIRQISYDAKGNVVRDHRFDTSGKEIEDRVITYDAEGRVLTSWHKWGFSLLAGPRADLEELTHGGCGEVLAVSRSTNGEPVAKSSFSYDEAGHEIFSERIQFLPSAYSSRTSSSFDAEGHLTAVHTESLTNGEWTVTSRRQRQFDALGHLVLDETVGYPSERTIRQAWSFDANGDAIAHETNGNWGRHEVRIEAVFACFY